MDKFLDTSPLALEFYKIIYDGCFDNLDFSSGLRPYINIKEAFGYKLKNNIELSGDKDFNFSKGYAWSRLDLYHKSLENSEVDAKTKKMVLHNLELCEELTDSCVNISLLPKTGALNIYKQCVGNDRLDVFASILNMYYVEGKEFIFSLSSFDNMPIIKEFLDIFKEDGIESYFANMYRTSNGGMGLVDELVELGGTALYEYWQINKFMNLAYTYWSQRLKYINKVIEDNHLEVTDEVSMELARVIELLNAWYSEV